LEENINGKVKLNIIDKIQNVSIKIHLNKTLKAEENNDELDSDLVNLTEAVINKFQYVLETKFGYITVSAVTNEYIAGSGLFQQLELTG